MMALAPQNLQLVLYRDSPFPDRGASHLIKYYGAQSSHSATTRINIFVELGFQCHLVRSRPMESLLA